MQFNNKLWVVLGLVGIFSLNFAYAGDKKTYTEDEFLNSFSGKSAKVITEKLGTPSRKEQSVKPSNATSVIAGTGGKLGKEDTSKPVNVEMWYYDGLVTYAPKKAYKFTEITLVNGRCMNIAFFNNK